LLTDCIARTARYSYSLQLLIPAPTPRQPCTPSGVRPRHTVDHGAGQYVTEKSNGTNNAENFFSQLKRSLDGTHHHVSRTYLPNYLAEFDFRYSTREISDTQRMTRLMGQIDN
jgi:hypothetical protein